MFKITRTLMMVAYLIALVGFSYALGVRNCYMERPLGGFIYEMALESAKDDMDRINNKPTQITQ